MNFESLPLGTEQSDPMKALEGKELKKIMGARLIANNSDIIHW